MEKWTKALSRLLSPLVSPEGGIERKEQAGAMSDKSSRVGALLGLAFLVISSSAWMSSPPLVSIR